MKTLIAHRGCVEGPNTEKENSPAFLLDALTKGYHTEVDLWYSEHEDKWFTGHDFIQYPIEWNFLYRWRYMMWCHSKNIPTLLELQKREMHCFFHNTDDAVLTSQGFIWTYPRKELILGVISIAVLPEKVPQWDLSNAWGVCTDYVKKYEQDLNE